MSGAARVAEVRRAKRLLESLWLWILVAAFAAAAVPWFARALEIDLAGLAATLFATAAAMFVAGRLSDRLRGRRALAAAAAVPHFAGIAVLGWAWLLAGGLGHPLFLLVFALPVAASAAGPLRAQAASSALLGAAVGGGAAWCQSPDLQWYCLQLGLPLEWAAGWTLPVAAPAGTVELTPAFHFTTVAAFAVLLPAVAAVVESVAWLAARDRLLAAAGAGAERDPLRAAFEADATPAVLMLADDGRVAAGNPSFRRRLLLDADPAGAHLSDLLRLDDPALLGELLAGGEEPAAGYRVGAEARTARLRANAFEHGGERFVLLTIEDSFEGGREAGGEGPEPAPED